MKLSALAMILMMTSCAASQSHSEGPWRIAVTSSGGLMGKGAGNYAIDSDGKIEVTTIGGKTCTYQATAEELARFRKLIDQARPDTWKESYAPENRCCDRFEYNLTLDRAGSERTTEWIDDPLPMPKDIRYRLDLAGGATMDTGCYAVHMNRSVAGAEPTVVRDIQTLLRTGTPDPKAMLASLFTRAGVRFTPGPDGVPRLQ